MDSNSYYYCSKSKIWIPAYVFDVHTQQCHDIKDCEMFHPIIREGMLHAKINLIKKEVLDTKFSELPATSNKISQGNWIFCDEPKIMQRIGCKFSEKMAFFSESDLYCCGIEGFSSVLLKANNSRAVFTAVPCSTVQIGTLHLYEKGIINDLPTARDTTLVLVEKIDSWRIGKDIKLKTSHNGDGPNSLIPRMFKRKFHYAYDYGIPFLFEKNDTVSVAFTEKKDVKVKVVVEDSLNCGNYLHGLSPEEKDKSEGSVIRSLTLLSLEDSFPDSSPGSQFSGTRHRVGKEDLSSIEGFNGDRSFKTSTPRKEIGANRTSKGEWSKKRRKRKGDETSSSSFVLSQRAQLSSSFYRLSKDSRIEMATEEAEDGTLFDNRVVPYFKDESFDRVRELIQKKLLHGSQSRNLRCPWTGILLSGLPGTGKSLLVKEVSAELGLPLIIISLLGWADSSSVNYIEDCFHEARQRAPSILLFEEIDSLCHSAREQDREKFTSKILKMLSKLKTLSKPILVIGTSNRSEAIPDPLKRVGRFDREVILSLPSPGTRGKILWELLGSLSHSLTLEDVNRVGERAFGLSKADLDSVIRVAWQKAIYRWKNEKAGKEGSPKLHLNACDLEEGINVVTPSFLRQNYSAISAVRWSDIFGYYYVKTKLKKMVSQSPHGNNFSKGILLYGPPGCSKTMLVRALATETRFTFFPVKCSDLLSKFVGETEKCLCSVFKRATLSAPSLIFMDEIDSLCGTRSGKGNDSNVVTELLSLLHKSRKEANIFVVGATNRPQAVDEAIFSPGGLELLLHVDLPDCSSRCSIWEGLLKVPPTYGEISIQLLCSRSKGFSCAEICMAYQSAANFLLNSLHCGKIKREESKLTEEHLLKAVDCSEPRTARSVLSAIESFKSTKKATHE